jgi:formamidopyrimidine-DNA glycosylase
VPEFPDLTVYVERLRAHVQDRQVQAIRLWSPFLVRTVAPPLDAWVGQRIRAVRRFGKRLLLTADQDLHLLIHLMIAGRLRWKKRGARPPGKMGLCAFDFEHGTLLMTEAASRKRASLHVLRGAAQLLTMDRGGLEVLECSEAEFAGAMGREQHTLKRALTDQTILSGIGNAYSDEILHRARLSPFRMTRALTADELRRLYDATRQVLEHWTELLRRDVGEGFPDKVTAFRPRMAVHGRFGKPCPDCGKPVQRIRYADNECNYCAVCQTGGRLLADRALSQLLKKDWPRTLEELEERRLRARADPERD